jgi:hypothetical protein
VDTCFSTYLYMLPRTPLQAWDLSDKRGENPMSVSHLFCHRPKEHNPYRDELSNGRCQGLRDWVNGRGQGFRNTNKM